MPQYRLEGTSVVRNGIVVHYDNELGRAVWVRVRRADDGRWEITEVYLPPEDRTISTDDLRRVPLGRIESFCNHPDSSAQLADRLSDEHLTLEEAVHEMDQRYEEITRHSRRQRQLSLRLPVPEGRGQRYDDTFYAQVAKVYLRLVEQGRAPAPEIAEANDVPPTTARRWVKEARRRGFLPPGRAGKVG